MSPLGKEDIRNILYHHPGLHASSHVVWRPFHTCSLIPEMFRSISRTESWVSGSEVHIQGNLPGAMCERGSRVPQKNTFCVWRAFWHTLTNPPPPSISFTFTFTSCDLAEDLSLASPSTVHEEHQPRCSSAHQSGSPAAMKWAICGTGRAQSENNGFIYSRAPDFLSWHSHCLSLDSNSLKKGSVSHEI